MSERKTEERQLNQGHRGGWVCSLLHVKEERFSVFDHVVAMMCWVLSGSDLGLTFQLCRSSVSIFRVLFPVEEGKEEIVFGPN